MQKYLLNTFIAGLLLLLGGCQSNRGGAPNSLFPMPFGGPSVATSTSLAESVQEALMQHDELAVARIHVETRQNVVILSGYVKKIRQSDTAEQIARQVPGVQSVENRIIIRP